MKINGTISRHNNSYMFKKENLAQKQQIIIAWEAHGSNQDQYRMINIINYFLKY